MDVSVENVKFKSLQSLWHMQNRAVSLSSWEPTGSHYSSCLLSTAVSHHIHGKPDGSTQCLDTARSNIKAHHEKLMLFLFCHSSLHKSCFLTKRIRASETEFSGSNHIYR